MNKGTLLIVEDNDDIFEYYSVAINMINNKINIIRTIGCTETVEIFKKYHDIIDLILMDVKLDDCLSYNIVSELLKDKKLDIIVQSADNKGRELYLKLGCVDFIMKPVSIEKICKILNKYF